MVRLCDIHKGGHYNFFVFVFFFVGYAWSGGGQKIYRVDVSVDKGKTWHVADFLEQGPEEPPKHWGWTLWSANVPVDPNTKTVCILLFFILFFFSALCGIFFICFMISSKKKILKLIFFLYRRVRS